jgi:hypothetical protein
VVRVIYGFVWVVGLLLELFLLDSLYWISLMGRDLGAVRRAHVLAYSSLMDRHD